MLADASFFPIHLTECDIFCNNCAQIEKFGIFSQDKYNNINYNYNKKSIPKNKPLFCKCEKCRHSVIYATNEFAILQEEPNLGLCKILGKGILTISDLVYHPTEGLCEVIKVDYGNEIILRNKKKEKFEIPFEVNNVEEIDNTYYRLYPQDAEKIRIGDLVYDTDTKMFGKAVGLEFKECRYIILQTEDEKIIKIKDKANKDYLTDDILEKNALWRCEHLQGIQNLKIYSNSKILNVICNASSSKAIFELNEIISSIPQTRCFITNIFLEKKDINVSEIYKTLTQNCIYICDCSIEIKNQDVYISGFYSAKDTPKNIYNVLGEYPIKKINLDIKIRSEIKSIKTIRENDYFIKITKIDKDVFIDGWINNKKDRWYAKRKAFLNTFSFKIKDNLLLIVD